MLKRSDSIKLEKANTSKTDPSFCLVSGLTESMDRAIGFSLETRPEYKVLAPLFYDN